LLITTSTLIKNPHVNQTLKARAPLNPTSQDQVNTLIMGERAQARGILTASLSCWNCSGIDHLSTRSLHQLTDLCPEAVLLVSAFGQAEHQNLALCCC
jgi:hypothetical protein